MLPLSTQYGVSPNRRTSASSAASATASATSAVVHTRQSFLAFPDMGGSLLT